jgi:hypothetical protein
MSRVGTARGPIPKAPSSRLASADPEEDDTLGYLMESVSLLRRALDDVVARGHGLLVTIT